VDILTFQVAPAIEKQCRSARFLHSPRHRIRDERQFGHHETAEKGAKTAVPLVRIASRVLNP